MEPKAFAKLVSGELISIGFLVLGLTMIMNGVPGSGESSLNLLLRGLTADSQRYSMEFVTYYGFAALFCYGHTQYRKMMDKSWAPFRKYYGGAYFIFIIICFLFWSKTFHWVEFNFTQAYLLDNEQRVAANSYFRVDVCLWACTWLWMVSRLNRCRLKLIENDAFAEKAAS